MRVVSLVPSLTEAVAGTGMLVGATDWCTHPGDLDVPRVRGTKNPDLAAIRDLRPDLVLANKEENRELDVRRLRESGVEVWVSVIETVPQALDELDLLFTDLLDLERPAWLREARDLWSGPLPEPRGTVLVPVWRDPWMVVGRDTFTGDLVRRLGWENVYAEADDRYPHVDEGAWPDPDLVLLPDEPYEFSADDGPEAFPGTRAALVSGRLITWYGPSLVEASSLKGALADPGGQHSLDFSP